MSALYVWITLLFNLIGIVLRAQLPSPISNEAAWQQQQTEPIQEAAYRYLLQEARKRWMYIQEYSVDYTVGGYVKEVSPRLRERLRAFGYPVKRWEECRTSKRSFIRLVGI